MIVTVIGWALFGGVVALPLLSKIVVHPDGTREIDTGDSHAGEIVKWTGISLGMVAFVGGAVIAAGGGGPSAKGLPAEVVTPDPPSTPTIDATVVDTSTWYVDFSAYSGDGDDAQDSIAVTVLRQSAADTLFHAVSGVQTRDTVSDNTDLKADTTYRVLGRQKGTDGGWSNADTLEVTNTVAVVTGGDGVFVFNGGSGGTNSAGDSAGVRGPTFSGTSHDSTQVQVNELADGDFTTTPVWNEVLGAVETDTVTGLDSATVYIARIRYKDNGTWQSYDTLGVFAAAFGPEGGPNEPAGFLRLVGRAFNSIATGVNRGNGSFPWKWGESEGWDDHERLESNIFNVSDQSDAPFSPPNAHRFEYDAQTVTPGTSYSPGQTFPQIMTGGSADQRCNGCPLSLEQIYDRFAFKLGPNWEPNDNSGFMKMVFWNHYDGGNSSGGPYLKFGLTGPGTAFVQVDMQGTYEGQAAGYDGTARSQITPTTDIDILIGSWYEVEIHSILATDTLTQDGELHIWIKRHPDGTRTKVFELTDLRNISKTFDQANAKYGVPLYFDPIWGGQGGTIDNTFSWYLDHAWISGSETK